MAFRFCLFPMLLSFLKIIYPNFSDLLQFILLLQMGNRCLESLFYRSSNTDTIIRQMDSHLHPIQHTSNDHLFLYMPSYFEMETDIGFAVEKAKHVDTVRQQLVKHLSQLQNYISNRPFDMQLQQINYNIKLKQMDNLCYFCLEVQSVQLIQSVKNLTIKILTAHKKPPIKTIQKQKMDSSQSFDVDTCIKAYTNFNNSLIIQIGELTATLLLRQISQELAVIEVINLRKEGSLDPQGEISIRIECIKNVEEWKKKNLSQLQFRKKQIQKILKIGEVNLESSAKVFLVSSLSDRGVSRLSYYKEDNLQYIQFEK